MVVEFTLADIVTVAKLGLGLWVIPPQKGLIVVTRLSGNLGVEKYDLMTRQPNCLFAHRNILAIVSVLEFKLHSVVMCQQGQGLSKS